MKNILSVRVVPRARRSCVERQAKGIFKVFVAAAPEKGKANKEVIKALSDFFGIPRSKIRMIRGGSSRDKLIEIENGDPPARKRCG